MQALFVRHRTAVYRWLLRFVRNQTLAEDLLSEVFLDVWRQAGRFEGRSSVSTWLISIARFKALSASRRRTDAQLDETIEATVEEQKVESEVSIPNLHWILGAYEAEIAAQLDQEVLQPEDQPAMQVALGVFPRQVQEFDHVGVFEGVQRLRVHLCHQW